ncbi:MAG: Herpes virus major outer envelope glycoprotein [Nitrososphaeraceae archaeon]|nr:Herpes virus major outer envelope glycoprotein [Nitrososphaeraceae archaeon]
MMSVDLIMNQNERSTATVLSAIVISSLLAIAFLFVGTMNFSQKAIGQAEETFGENATFAEEVGSPAANQTTPAANQTTPAANQTTPAANQTTPAANQTTPTPTPTANQTAAVPSTAANVTTNVTSGDLEPVRDSLNTAREGLQDNDTQAALEAINDADGTLFALVTEEGSQGGLAEQLKTLQGNLDTARESLHNNDNSKALEDLNTADSQVLVITQALPEDEQADEPEEEEPEEGEEEPEEE